MCSESASLTSKGVAVTKPNVLTYPVYNLTTVKLIKTDAICESVVGKILTNWSWFDSHNAKKTNFCEICMVRTLIILPEVHPTLYLTA